MNVYALPAAGIVDDARSFAAGALLNQPVVVAEAGEEQAAGAEAGRHGGDGPPQLVVGLEVGQRVVAGEDDVERVVDRRRLPQIGDLFSDVPIGSASRS